MTISVDDRQAILNLVGRYNQAFDYGDVEAWVATFVPDGVFATSDGFSVQGHAALRDFASRSAQAEVAYRHWNSSHVVEGDGDTARHSCYLMVMKLDARPLLFGAGRYDDELRKIDGAWRFVRRTLTREWESPDTSA